MNERPPPPEEPASDTPSEAQVVETPELAKPAPRQISDVPILTYQARLGSRLQFVAGLVFVFTWFGSDVDLPWPWDPIPPGDTLRWGREALLAAGLVLMLTARSGRRLRLLFLALTAVTGLWLGGGRSFGPVPNWFLGARWADDAPQFCFLLTPAAALLVGGTLGAGAGVWSRLRVGAVAASAVTFFVFYWWPVGGQTLQVLFFHEVRSELRSSVVLGGSLAVLWGAGISLTMFCGVSAMRGRFDVRVHSLCARLALAFVLAVVVSRLAFAGVAQSGSLLRSFVLLLHALAIALRELALVASLGLAAALWLEHRENRRTTGWEQAF